MHPYWDTLFIWTEVQYSYKPDSIQSIGKVNNLIGS